MKTKFIDAPGKNLVGLLIFVAVSFSLMAVEFPPESSLEIRPVAGTNMVSVKIVDANDYVWILQSSSNLTRWTEVEALKIHNGNFQRNIPGNSATPSVFFRAFYDPARNIELTAPYMHDGRFATLEEVVEFYNSGVVNNPNLSPPLRGPNGQPLRLNLTTAQKAALVAFMKTLTDLSVTTDEKFSDPFNYGE
jgi:hypothetical protein